MNAAEYKSLTDPELVSLCLKGDAHAWETLILRYKRLIYSVTVRFGFSSADAADVFQSVCVKLIENLHQLKDESKVGAWLVTTTTRRCIHVRAMKYRAVRSAEGFDEVPDPQEGVEDLRIQSEREQAVRDALDRLPERCQRLIQLLYFDSRNPSYDEVSQTLGMPVPSIGPTRARCLEKLRYVLQRYGIR